MQIIIRGHGLEVTEALKGYAEKKIGKVEKFFNNIRKIEIALDWRKIHDLDHSHVTQVTVWLPGGVLRSEEASGDMYSSIDLVFSHLMRQVKRYKEKHFRKYRKSNNSRRAPIYRGAANLEEIPLAPLPKEKVSRGIVRVKRFSMKPFTPEEAAEQMELLGHNFYMFLNTNTNEVNVIYQRQSGNYGLIEPEL